LLITMILRKLKELISLKTSLNYLL